MNCPSCHRGMRKLAKNEYGCFNETCPNRFKGKIAIPRVPGAILLQAAKNALILE